MSGKPTGRSGSDGRLGQLTRRTHDDSSMRADRATHATHIYTRHSRPPRLQSHLTNYHNAERQFSASGTKQLKIAIAFFDSDQLEGVHTGSLS